MKPRFLVDEGLTGFRCLESIGEVRTYDGLPAVPEPSWQPEALFIRSVSVIGEERLKSFPRLKHVFTATAGCDHIDFAACEERGIQVWNAPGHNAESVGDWVWTALLKLSSVAGKRLKGLRLGIVGAGHAGMAVSRRASAHGVDLILYDPPREQRESGFVSASWEAILNADVISFHVPLVRDGSWPTLGMFSPEELRSGQWLLNASRGDVLRLSNHPVPLMSGALMALDVFPSEPHVSADWVRRCLFASPHVGGNTFRAKLGATEALFRQADALYGVGEPADLPGDSLGEFGVREVRVHAGMSPEAAMLEVVNGIHGLVDLSAAFKKALEKNGVENTGALFKSVRKSSRRRALQGVGISGGSGMNAQWEKLFQAHGMTLGNQGRSVIQLVGSLPFFEA